MDREGSGTAIGRVRALLARHLKRRQERRFASRVCTESLAALRAVRAAQPDLEGAALYGAAVARRNKLGSVQARVIVQRAQESIGDWETDHEARFIDVVKYLIVSEYLAQNAGENGMIIDLGALLAPRIDPRL